MVSKGFWLVCLLAVSLSSNVLAGTLDCSGAIRAYCGDVFSGDTSVLPNTAENYSCSGLVENGGEQVYIMDVVAPLEVTATILSGPFLNIYLLSACDEGSCIIWDSDEIVHFLFPGRYYFVIDSSDTVSGAFEVMFTCASMTVTPSTSTTSTVTVTPSTSMTVRPTITPTPTTTSTPTITSTFSPTSGGSLDCSGAIHVTCGDIISGDTDLIPNTADNYSCNTLRETGGEQVFILDLPIDTATTVAITSGTFFNLYLLARCDENTCYHWDPDFISRVLPAGPNYFVIDSVASVAGPYEVEFRCTLPTDTPTLTPTITPTPTDTPPPVPTDGYNVSLLLLLFIGTGLLFGYKFPGRFCH